MKKSLFLSAMPGILMLASLTSCDRTVAVRNYQFSESSDYADLSMSIDLPSATRGAAGTIRESIIDIMDGQLAYIASFEYKRLVPAFDGNRRDDEALLDYYRSHAIESLSKSAKTDSEEFERDFYPRWEYDFGISKEYETDNYVVFLSEDFVYFGGAHGGITGEGYVTFDKSNGLRFENFLREDCLPEIQPLLAKGLAEYMSDAEQEVSPENLRDYYFLDEELIPLPTWMPYPAEDGLNFIYQQYEIAAYAYGMPEFTIPYDVIRPFLTPEAVKLLGL